MTEKCSEFWLSRIEQLRDRHERETSSLNRQIENLMYEKRKLELDLESSERRRKSAEEECQEWDAAVRRVPIGEASTDA